ncbi:ESX secretion-associated protein EspG [Amycolatopsis sp. WAC 01375]|uniref:ESX secretion-associated protein EspG n=1 Tax=unclassified Amycolatopsis TaxID=2618356 RepID=UPI000F7B1E9B|nr:MULTISPECIES: ESX secretion-associated protein EspG [unclassified Amycolatopsis]RSM83396.1 ESX secretion-associated protein EspG [Amycolatopsis sp. WAC 01375]RSN35518.1 ESX secretion-associated protein EspG [Amycolatopsis sp. WAC 01416]
MAERADFALGTVEATVVGQALGVDVRLFPLRVRNTSIDPERYAAVIRKVYADLEQRRLSISGELNQAIRTAFALLSNHRITVSVNGIDGIGQDIAVLTLTDGRQALGITQAHGEDLLQFALFADEELVEVLAGVLPRMRPASTGRRTLVQQEERAVSAMTARRQAEAEFDEEETDAFGNLQFTGVVRARPESPSPRNDESDVAVLEQVLSGTRLGGGHIIVSGIGRRGERLRSTPLSWLDTEDGRYLVWTETDEASGAVIGHYDPASQSGVANAIRAAIADIY